MESSYFPTVPADGAEGNGHSTGFHRAPAGQAGVRQGLREAFSDSGRSPECWNARQTGEAFQGACLSPFSIQLLPGSLTGIMEELRASFLTTNRTGAPRQLSWLSVGLLTLAHMISRFGSLTPHIGMLCSLSLPLLHLLSLSNKIKNNKKQSLPLKKQKQNQNETEKTQLKKQNKQKENTTEATDVIRALLRSMWLKKKNVYYKSYSSNLKSLIIPRKYNRSLLICFYAKHIHVCVCLCIHEHTRYTAPPPHMPTVYIQHLT